MSSPIVVVVFYYAIYIFQILGWTTEATDAFIHPPTNHNFPKSQPNPIPSHHHTSTPNNDPSPPPPPPPPYQTRSTCNPSPTTPFSTNSTLRQARLDSALTSLNISPSSLTTSPQYRGTPALRAYTSFILPKSHGAFAIAESPQRAAVVADHISFLLREQRSHEEEWIRNHDRSLGEVGELVGRGGGRLVIVLDNVRSAHNVGNILRAAEASLASHVYLCGITPTPPDRKVLKTAVGSAEYVPHTHVGNALATVRRLQEEGVKVYGVETTGRSESLWELKVGMERDVALVFGNEVVGVHGEVLEVCDGLVAVPTMGVKNSLNVATCVSIVVWEVLRQWDQSKRDSGEMGDGEAVVELG